MNTKESIINIAKETIELESESIANLANLIDDDFADAVNLYIILKVELSLLVLVKVPLLQLKL